MPEQSPPHSLKKESEFALTIKVTMVPKGMAERVRLFGYTATVPEPVPILLIVKDRGGDSGCVPTCTTRDFGGVVPSAPLQVRV